LFLEYVIEILVDNAELFSVGVFMKRDLYTRQLVRKMHNGMIKVVTGIRRCGKSYLLFNLFRNHLVSENVPEDHILEMAFDLYENKKFQNPEVFYPHIKSQIKDGGMYYVLLDEVQLLGDFEAILNSLLRMQNVDVYVTGSNAKFLSKDVITEFRGRGDQIHLYPLSFAEFLQAYKGSSIEAWREYSMYGGLPKLLDISDDRDKAVYLESIFSETYLKDILERNDVRNTNEISELFDFIASSVGGLSNPKKLSDTFKSVKNVSIHPDTIKTYLDYFEESFLISRAVRYDIKGKKYINTPSKYYFTDMGLRNARVHFRQYEETHIMENIIYNELLTRGYSVDVGVVEVTERTAEQKKVQKQLEVDFVCNLGSSRLYIQSALSISDAQKEKQEQNSLERIPDSFEKIIIVKDIPTHYNDSGILILNLFDFLMNTNPF
jgi:predicted AAA+ superfamily ATPase